MDVGTGITLAGGIIGLVLAAEKFFSRNTRTEVSASHGEKAAATASAQAAELDKQTAVLRTMFETLSTQIKEQNEALRSRDKEIGDRVHTHSGKLQEHDGRLLHVESSFGRLEKVAVEALSEMAKANAQGATAIAAVAAALDALKENVDVSARLARLEALFSQSDEHLPRPRNRAGR